MDDAEIKPCTSGDRAILLNCNYKDRLIIKRLGAKWHNLISLLAEIQDFGPIIYARSPEWTVMTELTKMRYALSEVCIATLTISIADEETESSKLHTFLKPKPKVVIPEMARTLNLLLVHEQIASQ
jgi:hypothetical protein